MIRNCGDEDEVCDEDRVEEPLNLREENFKED